MEKQNSCCVPVKKTGKKGFLRGLLYGLMPHTFCIGFIVFSVIGATAASAIFKKVLLIPYFFQILIGLSLIFATISAVLYLRKTGCLCVDGIKKRWKYITTMYTITIVTNLLIFFVIFPAVASMKSDNIVPDVQLSNLSISVQIPCSGHAPLIIDELKKNRGVNAVEFKMLNTFNIQYDPKEISPDKIVSLQIFKDFKATIL
jgi:hypothetical protein